MLQLELFPRTELFSLSDFHRLESLCLNLEEKKILIHHPHFFVAPKENDVIRRQHAHLLDRILDFRVKYIEEMLIAEGRGFDPDGSFETWGPALHQGAQTWVGLDFQTLQTPYGEILKILKYLKLKPYQHVVDLGAAYGRMGMVIGGAYPKNFFSGFEYVKGRVEEGNRIYQELGLKNCKLYQTDLTHPEFELPEADAYFIYDYGQPDHIMSTLKQLEKLSFKRPFKIIVRGKITKSLIKAYFLWQELDLGNKKTEAFSFFHLF